MKSFHPYHSHLKTTLESVQTHCGVCNRGLSNLIEDLFHKGHGGKYK